MSTVGQIERATQQRVVKLFRIMLGYDYLGNWIDRVGNRNIDSDLSRSFLKKQGYDDALITKALHQFEKVAGDQTKSLYDCNKAVYELLRYGVKVKADVGENTQTVWLIDWKRPLNNHFGIAEEVTVKGADAKANDKRPDVVLYVNGIALGVLELKRSTVSVSEGIRQNLDNQKKIFIQPFFTTMQLVMAGNDTEGVRYGTVETKEKYYLTWKQDSDIENLLDRHLTQLCGKAHFLELIHDFIVFDAGVKKLCRHNQYFGVKAAQEHVKRREGGIIWHTQGSGKSLTMVWLAKWLRGNVKDARVVVITDRTELDQQIETVFKGVSEEIHRTTSGADLISKLNATTPWLIASLIHKFAGKEDDEQVGDIDGFIAEMKRSLPADFKAKGDIYVFVDECHRTQSGELHKAMKAILPSAMFIGFTGTPLLKADKQKSIEIFGKYIHTYKFDEAVRDKVVLDLRYEARDIDQSITSPAKIDQWFDSKTRGLNDVALAQLKKKWGSMQKVLSSKSRLENIVADILMDMATKDRLQSGRGNAMLVTSSIYEACKCYELFENTELAGKCAIVTSYAPSPADIKGEETGEGLTERLRKYEIYNRMLGDKAVEDFEKEVKKKFINEPGQMKLLIVVDKLLTGFDAPSATYLYIDKQMQDHGLFQAICRVNRLDGDDKEYGYIVDYKDLFKSLGTAIHDYTSGALDGYDKEDVAGLLVDRLESAKERLEEAREAIKALCELVEAPKDTAAYLRYFCAYDTADKNQLKENESKRITLYKLAVSLIRAYADLASEMAEAGYSVAETDKIKQEVDHYEKVRSEVKMASGDYIDLKMYEPAMRHLIDTYIRAEDSEKISAFDDMSLIQMIVERGVDALDMLPAGIRENKEAVAETIENNLRKVIIDEQPINPKYYEKMSELLDSLILQRREQALEYEKYLAELVALAEKVQKPGGADYPKTLNTGAKRALYDNLGKDENLALAVDYAVVTSKKDGWRGHKVKEKEVRYAVKRVLHDEKLADDIFELVKNQSDY
ncbi:MAG: type I restriction endonuclease subunit R [Gallionellaceae bacterium]